MSDLKKLLIFAAFLVVFVVAAQAGNYRDDEPNPWHVMFAFELFLALPYLLAALVGGLAIRAFARASRAKRRR
jgi:cytochrome c biogenesis protein CcdA